MRESEWLDWAIQAKDDQGTCGSASPQSGNPPRLMAEQIAIKQCTESLIPDRVSEIAPNIWDSRTVLPYSTSILVPSILRSPA